MHKIRETLRRVGLPVGVVVIMVSMFGFLLGPTASAQTGYPPPPDQVASISGRVVDSVTGAPVPFGFATLFRCDIECLFVTSQFANFDGAFRFDASPFAAPMLPGNYYVIASAFGYDQFQTNTFSAAVGEHVVLGDLAIVKTPAIGAINGNLVDAQTGQPITSSGSFILTRVTLYRCTTDGLCNTLVSQQSIFGSDFQFVFSSFGTLIGPGDFVIEVLADRYRLFQSPQFTVAIDEFKDLGNLALTPVPTIGSISGQVVDELTGGPVPGSVDPGANASLYYCSGPDPFGCLFPVMSQNVDALGRFHFDSDFVGRPLLAGEYRILVSADQYNFTFSDTFTVGENENHDLGKVKIQSFPVRFSDIRGCDNISAGGGTCRYSIRVTSGMATPIDAASWSVVNASSFDPSAGSGGFSTFQTDQARKLRLRPGQSQVLNFSFRVPAGATAGTFICTSAYVSKDASTRLFNTIGFRSLFCITKTSDTGGFRRMTDRERREHERQHRNESGSQP